eukprot:TRINITY_DN16883_c0_g1_i1.p1 TRINITY_DN16883_c0_g1~~TRINITY_DN16883_c0_g1_i1.p1  ORF type:complete len:204 (-),score=47.16 TRINITY_DN16883_c0_g1_i1:285-896(-)
MSEGEATTTDSSHPPKSRIYTRTGDGGQSHLYTGQRRSKSDAIFEALGNVDELNANLGVAREHIQIAGNQQVLAMIEEIQSILFDIGANIATPGSSATSAQKERMAFSDAHLPRLERWIDETDAALPPLKNFILPCGGLASTHLHVARAVCRRAERSLVPLLECGDLSPGVQSYMNRLSDFLFVAARNAAAFEKREEVIYKKH